MKTKLTLLLLLLVFSFSANAAYLKDIPMKVVQPNGDTLHCYASGDEFFNYLHDKEGFTIMQSEVTGYYMYAIHRGDQIVVSTYIAGTVNPSEVGLRPNVLISAEQYQSRRAKWFEYEPIPQPKTPGRNHGAMNNLCVFIRFSDETNITTLFSTVDNMFNSTTSGVNSMYNYFKNTSYDHLRRNGHFSG